MSPAMDFFWTVCYLFKCFKLTVDFNASAVKIVPKAIYSHGHFAFDTVDRLITYLIGHSRLL